MKLSDKQKRVITRFMQASLFAILAAGLYLGSSKAVVNSSLGLIVTFAPAVIERRYGIVASPFLALWITSAVFFHALGSFGLYGSLWWWDHLTHALSASIVAGIGYTFIRSVDIYSEDIYLPQRFMFVFILLTILAFGVTWEIFEYGLDVLADMTGVSMPLSQHGLEDSMKDMMFNAFGALITAVFAQVHLSDLAEEWVEKYI
jgi:hypothetical protein